MAGFGKSSRMSKRPHSSSSSSSSSYVSMASMVIFAALCLLGVWMLTTSSIVSSSSSRRGMAATTDTSGGGESASDFFFRSSRAAFLSFHSTPPPSLLLRDPGDLPNDAGRGGDGEGRREAVKEVSEEEEETTSAGRTEEEKPEAPDVGETDRDNREDPGGEEPQREEDSESRGRDGAGGGSQEEEGEKHRQLEQEQGQVAEEETQPEHQAEGGSDENQQQQQQQSQESGGEQEEEGNGAQESGGEQEEQGNGGDHHRPEQNADGENNDDNQHQQEKSDSTEEETESKSQNGGESEENQQQSQQQETENEDFENQQQQQRVEGEGNENHQQRQHEEGEGNENQEQSHQEQAEAEGNENQPLLQQKMEEGGAEGQESSLQQTDSEESHEEAPRQQTEEVGINATSEESQQQGADEKPNDDPNVSESLPDGSQLEVSNGSDGKKMAWLTQADHSENEKERRREESHSHGGGEVGNIYGFDWKLCNVTAGPDYIPCLDNVEALRHIPTKHYEHRERHCPKEGPACLVSLPKGYRLSIEWPRSRDRIWYNNVPHTKLAVVKGHQNWVKTTGQYLTFPGGGTQFIHGALHYIDFIQKAVHEIAWGKRTRVILDVGCGVASFGGFLFERDVLAMSFAPKDEHEAQVQLALERGIPAISAVMGSQRLPFPSRVFDLVHCARCRVPWHVDGGALLLELNRVLRPGGYFVWSATPVYQKLKEDVEIWKAMTSLTISMCWDLITIKKDRLNSVGAAIYRKPISNDCYDNRKHHSPPMCKEEDDPNAAWYVPLQSCMHRVPTDASERGSQWPAQWPPRLQTTPYWLNSSQLGVYGKPAPDDFSADYEHWKRVVSKSYLSGLGISWSKVRNVMDMRAVYGGFAAALKDLKVWVMNVVNIDSPDTLPIIFERGFFGIYHDWCESFSTYPRTYDLLHADHLFSRLKKRCDIIPVMAEVDRILRPGGKLIVRDESSTVNEVENWLKSLHWEVRLTFSKGQEGILCAEKSDWRPETFSDSS